MSIIKNLVDTFLKQTDGLYAYHWIKKISRYNRLPGSKDFHQISVEIESELKNFQNFEIIRETFPFDGKTKVLGWKMPYSYEIRSAKLSLLTPKEEIIANFEEIPMSVIRHSNSCDIKAELIDIGTKMDKNDLKGKYAKGKIVLMENTSLINQNIWKDIGAIGFILYPSSSASRKLQNRTTYQTYRNVGHENQHNHDFGFSISYNSAMKLKDLIQKSNKVMVHAYIDASFSEGENEVLSALIPGTIYPNKEIIITAHLCHPAPSANDNASGAAGLLALCQSYNTLLEEKKIESPKYSIRFLWMAEFLGTIAWVNANIDTSRNAIVNINLDMIGEDPKKIGMPLLISHTSFTTPSIINELVHLIVPAVADNKLGIDPNGTSRPMNYRFIPFIGGTDHQVFSDEFIGIPAITFGHSDPFWHSSLDTYKNCDPTELKRVISIIGSISYVISNFSKKTLTEIYPFLISQQYERFGRYSQILHRLIRIIPDQSKKKEDLNMFLSYAKQIMISAKNHEKHLINNFKREYPTFSLVNEYINHLEQNLENWVQFEKSKSLEPFLKKMKYISNSETLSDSNNLRFSTKSSFMPEFLSIIPVLNFSTYKKIQFKSAYDTWLGDFFEILNILRKKCSIYQIAAILSLEYQKLYFPEDIQNFLNDLKELGILK